MIQFCTCNKRFTTPLEIPEGQQGSKSCKSCGGILSVDELGGLSRRISSTMGPEFSGVIDPQLKWKTSANGKHRALRRARIFTQYDGKKFTPNKKTEDIEYLFDEASKKQGGDSLASESEKFGVSVLGGRFGENLESVPIKKRRFSLPPQSTPPVFSSSGFREVSLKQDESAIHSSHGVDWDEKRCLEDSDEHTGDCADFSGISILAAAACYSSIESMDAKGPTVKGHSFEENPSSISLEDKDQPSKLELGNKPKPEFPTASFTAGEAPGREPGLIKFDECKDDNSVGSLQKISNERKSMSVRDDRLHWDLNTVMDVWESQSDDLSKDEASFGIHKVGLIAAHNQDISQCFKEIERNHASPVADSDEGKHGLPNTQVSVTLREECEFMDTKVMVANAPEKTSPAGGGEKIAQLDRDLSANLVDVFDEEKHEIDNVNSSVEVDTHNTLPCLVNATLGGIMNACDRFSEEKKVNQMLLDDSISIANVANCNDHSGEWHPAYGKGNQLRSPRAEKHQSYTNLDQSTARLNSEGTSDKELFPSRNTPINQYKVTSTDLKIDPLEEHLDSEHYSDPDNATGLEKVEFFRDDDSQYEDGELRESVLNSWGKDGDGLEEVETEHVDYGSDGGEADLFEAESDFCSQSDMAVSNTECKHEKKLVSTSIDGNRSKVITDDDSPTKCFQKNFLIKDMPNVNHGEVDVRKNLDIIVASELSARDKERLLSSNVRTDGSDVPGKSSQPDSSRVKSSGWDKLPIRDDAPVIPLSNHDDASAATSVNGEYSRKVFVTSVKWDSSSRVEIVQSSEASCRKEVSYTAENKKLDHFAFNAKRSTNASMSRSTGRSRIPFRSQGRDRADCWVGSPDHRGGCRFDVSGYHSSPNFASPGARNAAAAAVAKVESNGFVVSPDGTIVKAVSMESVPHLSGRSSKTSTHLQSSRRGSTMESDGAFDMSSEPSNSTREISPDRGFYVGRGRGGRHGSRFINLGHRNMYHAPILDRRFDSLSSRHPSSRRQRSFSPQRRPVHFSCEHTRSPSRSKTRSPHNWSSPRGRDNVQINGDPGVRRQSRSPPNFKIQRRMPRQRSPQRHVIPAEELPVYASSSRSHSSPRHASRWFDHLHERQARCPTGRSSPARNFSPGNRLDHIDSRGKQKPDDYYQRNYSGRFHEYAGYGRGSKHDSRDNDRRGRSSSYQSFHPEGHLESNSNMKCFGYGENGIRTHNLRPNPSAFQLRESPRPFDRSIDAQRKDSPQRIKGEMLRFGHGRDGKLNPDLQRRPS